MARAARPAQIFSLRGSHGRFLVAPLPAMKLHVGIDCTSWKCCCNTEVLIRGKEGEILWVLDHNPDIQSRRLGYIASCTSTRLCHKISWDQIICFQMNIGFRCLVLEKCRPFFNVSLQGYCSCKCSCHFCWLFLAGSVLGMNSTCVWRLACFLI